jgi:hypothetical protein
MGIRLSSRGAGALTSVVLLGTLGTTARAQTSSGHLSLSYDGGLMHSTSVHLLDTKPETAVADGPANSLCFGLSGIGEYLGAVAGVRGDVALGILGPAPLEAFLGGLAGFRLTLGNWRVQATGELGEHFLWIGGGEFQGYPHALLPFVGASLEVGHNNGVRPGHLGLSAFIRKDLGQRTVPAHADFISTGGGDTVHEVFDATYSVGGTTIGLGLNVTTN